MLCGRVELLLDVRVDQVELVVPAGVVVAAEVVDDGVCFAALERDEGRRRTPCSLRRDKQASRTGAGYDRKGRGPSARSPGRPTLASTGQSRRDISVRRDDWRSSEGSASGGGH
jgi:hypothetical protein